MKWIDIGRFGLAIVLLTVMDAVAEGFLGLNPQSHEATLIAASFIAIISAIREEKE